MFHHIMDEMKGIMYIYKYTKYISKKTARRNVNCRTEETVDRLFAALCVWREKTSNCKMANIKWWMDQFPKLFFNLVDQYLLLLVD